MSWLAGPWPWSLSVAAALGAYALLLLFKISDCLKGILDELVAIRTAINGPAYSRESIGDQLEALSSDIRPISDAIEDIRLRLKWVAVLRAGDDPDSQADQ